MAGITFTITETSGKQAKGTLSWPDKNLEASAVSGPYGEGYLPEGSYTAKRAQLVDERGPNNSYVDKKGNGWFQALKPDFATTRTGLGIHPDGNVAGTEGCIGLTIDDTKPWYNALRSVVGSIAVTVEIE